MIVSRTVSSGKSRACLEASTRGRAGAGGDRGLAVDLVAEHLDASRSRARSPQIAFISVDLPAPLVPMSPTSSPGVTSNDASLTATLPPKRTCTSSNAAAGCPGGRRPSGDRPGGDRPVRPLARDLDAVPEPAVGPGQEHVARLVDDLHEAAREVHQQDQQADVAGDQPDEVVVVGEQRRDAAAPTGRRGCGPAIEPRPPMIAITTRSTPAVENMRRGLELGCRRDEQSAANAAMPPEMANAGELHPRRRHRRRGRPCPRSRGRRSAIDPSPVRRSGPPSSRSEARPRHR